MIPFENFLSFGKEDRESSDGKNRTFDTLGSKPLKLYIEHYRPDASERYAEMLEALYRNLRCPWVTSITIFAQDPVPALPDSHVLVNIVSSGRMTYQCVFDYVNARTQPEDVHILCNNDISLESGFDQLSAFLRERAFMALSRRELSGVDPVRLSTSQDVWAWKGECQITSAWFPMGYRGCDNRIAAEAQSVGYEVSNPYKSLAILHHHRSQVRQPGYHAQFVLPPYLAVPPCALGEKSEVSRMVYGEQVVLKSVRKSRRGELKNRILERLAQG